MKMLTFKPLLLKNAVLSIFLICFIFQTRCVENTLGRNLSVAILRPCPHSDENAHQMRSISVECDVNSEEQVNIEMTISVNGSTFITSTVSPGQHIHILDGLSNGKSVICCQARFVASHSETNDYSQPHSSCLDVHINAPSPAFTERMQSLQPTLKLASETAEKMDNTDLANMHGEHEGINGSLTLVTAAFNIGRRHKEFSFEDDYVDNLKHLLSLQVPIVVFCEPSTAAAIEPYTHKQATIIDLTIRELCELFPWHSEVENIRKREDWPPHGRQAGNVAKRENYNTVVMAKMYLLSIAAHKYAQSAYTFWIDAGFCARSVQKPLQWQWHKNDQYKFSVFGIAYEFQDGIDIHGFTEKGYEMLSNGTVPNMHLRGNIFGGSQSAIKNAMELYHAAMRDSLAAGIMGTEESVMTLASIRSPQSFQIIDVSMGFRGREQPCRMFRLLSSNGERIILPDLVDGTLTIFGPTFDVHTGINGLFEPGRDGQVCFVLAHARICSQSSTISLKHFACDESTVWDAAYVELVDWLGYTQAVSDRFQLILRESTKAASMQFFSQVADVLPPVVNVMVMVSGEDAVLMHDEIMESNLSWLNDLLSGIGNHSTVQSFTTNSRSDWTNGMNSFMKPTGMQMRGQARGIAILNLRCPVACGQTTDGGALDILGHDELLRCQQDSLKCDSQRRGIRFEQCFDIPAMLSSDPTLETILILMEAPGCGGPIESAANLKCAVNLNSQIEELMQNGTLKILHSAAPLYAWKRVGSLNS